MVVDVKFEVTSGLGVGILHLAVLCEVAYVRPVDVFGIGEIVHAGLDLPVFADVEVG